MILFEKEGKNMSCENCDEPYGVLVILQDSAYRSQRCSHCGLVRRANRKGKRYTCKGCGHSIDADINAAKNHEQDLYYLGWVLRRFIKDAKLNLGQGFYWRENGIFSITGEELTVPLATNEGSNV